MDKVVLEGMVDTKEIEDNMDMADKLNMVDNKVMAIFQKTHGYLKLKLIRQDRQCRLRHVGHCGHHGNGSHVRQQVYMLEKMDRNGTKRAPIGIK